jgi:hypothetical protein
MLHTAGGVRRFADRGEMRMIRVLGGLTGLDTTVDQRYGLLAGEHTSRSRDPDGSGGEQATGRLGGS